MEFNWLHFSDLHFGHPEKHWLWETIRQDFYNDLKILTDQVGKWDLVLFSGDLTYSGSKSQYELLSKELEKLWDHFRTKLKCEPKFLAIPGNHDLFRPGNWIDPVMKSILEEQKADNYVDNLIFEERDDIFFGLINSCFENYKTWFNSLDSFDIPTPDIKHGIISGDVSTIINIDGYNIGVIGLNSAYLQLNNSKFKEKLAIRYQQLQAVCDYKHDSWFNDVHYSFLMTHHPEGWLSPESQDHFRRFINKPDLFFSHVSGHTHQPDFYKNDRGGGDIYRYVIGSSLFGLKKHCGIERAHGYHGMKLIREENRDIFRCYPRKLYEGENGPSNILPNTEFLGKNNSLIYRELCSFREESPDINEDEHGSTEEYGINDQDIEPKTKEIDSFKSEELVGKEIMAGRDVTQVSGEIEPEIEKIDSAKPSEFGVNIILEGDVLPEYVEEVIGNEGEIVPETKMNDLVKPPEFEETNILEGIDDQFSDGNSGNIDKVVDKYKEFAQKYENNYVKNDFLDKQIKTITKKVSEPRYALRVIGLPGLGKSRLVFECFKLVNGTFVSYFDAQDDFGTIVDTIRRSVSEEQQTILVVDDCDIKQHEKLVREIYRADTHVSLVTIGCDLRQSVSHTTNIVIQPNDLISVQSEILKEIAPEFKGNEIDDIIREAPGYIALSIELCKSRLDNNDIDSVLIDEQYESKYFCRDVAGKEKMIKVLRVCSIFGSFKYDEEHPDEIEFIAGLTDIKYIDFFEQFKRLLSLGIIQKSGNYCEVMPKPVSVHLASDWWRYNDLRAIKDIHNLENRALQRSFFARTSRLDFVPEANKFVENICVEDWIAECLKLDYEAIAQMISFFAEVNPKAIANLLDRVFSVIPREDLLKIKKSRIYLIGALEKLCFWKETFKKAARTLLSFAASENETHRSNATRQFLQLFHQFLPGTQAEYPERIEFLEMALNSDSPEKRLLAIKALGKGLKSGHFTRSGGVEKQGSRASQRDYSPELNEELFVYRKECLNELTKIACSNNEFADAATNEIIKRTSDLIMQSGFGRLKESIDLINKFGERDWTDFRDKLHKVRSRREVYLSEELRTEIDKLADELSTNEVFDKLRYLVSIPEWRPKGKDGKRSVEEDAKNLASELMPKISDWSIYLPKLMQDEQRQTYKFGKRLGEKLESPQEFIDSALEVLGKISPTEGNFSVLTGFLIGLNDDSTKSATLDKFLSEKALLPYAIGFFSSAEPSLYHLHKLLDIIDEDDVYRFRYFRLYHLNDKDAVEFCERISTIGTSGLAIGFDLLYMYCFRNKIIENIGIFKNMLLNPNLLNQNENDTRTNVDLYHWHDIARIVVGNKDDIEFVKGFLNNIFEFFNNDISIIYRDRRYIMGALKVLIEKHGEAVSPIIIAGLIPTKTNLGKNLKEMLSTSDKFDKAGLTSVIPDEHWIKWCEDNPDEAPEIIAEIMPYFDESVIEAVAQAKSEDELNAIEVKWSPLAEKVINRFSKDKKVILHDIRLNLAHFSWSGSPIPKFNLSIKLVQALFDHKNPNLRTWAKSAMNYLEQEKKNQLIRLENRHRDIF